MVVAWLSASRLDSQEVYSRHMFQDGGCATRRLATRVTRQRRQYMIGVHGTGWRLGLESLSTVGADVQVYVQVCGLTSNKLARTRNSAMMLEIYCFNIFNSIMILSCFMFYIIPVHHNTINNITYEFRSFLDSFLPNNFCPAISQIRIKVCFVKPTKDICFETTKHCVQSQNFESCIQTASTSLT